MMRGNRIGKAVLLVAVEIAFFILFSAFMLTHQLGKTIAFIIFFIFLGILFKKWWGLNDAMASLFKEMKILAIGVFILMVLTLPFVFHASPYLIHICVMAGLYAILALGLNFQLGSTNVVNFATAASYGIGAYTSALLAVHFPVPFGSGSSSVEALLRSLASFLVFLV